MLAERMASIEGGWAGAVRAWLILVLAAFPPPPVRIEAFTAATPALTSLKPPEPDSLQIELGT